MDQRFLETLKRVISEANVALNEACFNAGTDDKDTLRRVLDRVNKAKCICESMIARHARLTKANGRSE
jgi:hypothetical protein